MRHQFAFLLLLFISSALWSAPVPKGRPVEVELLPLNASLFVGEPFEAFVRFTNRDEKEVVLIRDWDLMQRVGNVLLEVKGPKDQTFRCPYTVEYPFLSDDGSQNPLKKAVKSGATRCEIVSLPWSYAGVPPLFSVLDVEGEWEVRAKVVLHNQEEKVSPSVVVTLSKQTAAEAKRHADVAAELDQPIDKKTTTFSDEFKDRLKLVGGLGTCYRADQYRRQYLSFRLSVADTERSKETAEEVMKDIDAYLKSVSTPVRDHFCVTVAFDRLGRADAGDAQSIMIGQKYLKMAVCVPDSKSSLAQRYELAERLLKAKSPDAKDDKKPDKK